MGEEPDYTLRKTWTRNIEPIIKNGYMDGASDGAAAMFQSSFDVGYEQGLHFGLELGFQEALTSLHTRLPTSSVSPIQGVNCQICDNGVSIQENIGNLFNMQKEKNSEYLLKYIKFCFSFLLHCTSM